MDWNLLAGPAALSVAAVAAVIALWRAHVRDDAEKDATVKVLAAAVSAIAPALTALTEVVSDSAQRERDRPKNGRTDDR